MLSRTNSAQRGLDLLKLWMANMHYIISVPHYIPRLLPMLFLLHFRCWHYKLGHLSPNKFVALQKQLLYNIKSTYNKNCTICLLAKQKKLPDSLSSSKSIAMFDLLHMDIWGPFSFTLSHEHRLFLTVVDDFLRHT